MMKKWKIYAFCLTVLFLAIVVRDYLTHGPLSGIDLSVAAFFYRIRSLLFVRIFYFITLFAESSVVVILAVLLASFLWIKKQHIAAAQLVVSLAISESVTMLGKLFFHRLRPAYQAIHEASFSFPSGHATTVAVFYGFLVYLLFQTYKTRRVCCFLLCCLATIVILVDVSRLYLDVHYLSDVIAGNLIGFSGLLSAILLKDSIKKLFRKSDPAFSFTFAHIARLGIIALIGVVPLFLIASFA